MEKISKILDLLEAKEDNVHTLYKIFNSVNEHGLPIIRFLLPVGTSFIRQRINESGKYFSLISDLSYPPADKVTKYGRANIPYNPMFYCCTFRKSTEVDSTPRYVALLETSNFVKDINNSGIERATCSKWVSHKELSLIALPFSTTYLNPCKDIKEIQKKWKEAIAIGEINSESLELIEYMSNEIAKPFNNGNTEYFKIAHFIYYLMRINPKTKDADGLLYPSVPAGGEGYNVVLKPEVVDKYISFENASLCYLAKKQKQMLVMNVNHAMVDNDKIIYIDDIPNKEAHEKYFNELADGLSFVN